MIHGNWGDGSVFVCPVAIYSLHFDQLLVFVVASSHTKNRSFLDDRIGIYNTDRN